MAKNVILNDEQLLRRTVLSCLLWEDTFYEDGTSIASRIDDLVSKVDTKTVANLAIEVREKYKLRKVPIFLTSCLIKKSDSSPYIRNLVKNVIQRPDEITTLLDLYWKDGKKPLSKQLQKGIADSFYKFNEYQLAKWNRKGNIKLRDAMILSHPKPTSEEQSNLWKRLLNNELKTPDTWEVRLSTGQNKKQSWEELLTHNKMGALAILRNMRNFERDNVYPDIIIQALNNINTERILPYRFLTAVEYCDKKYHEYLENAMFKCIDYSRKLKGRTVILVDVSVSMKWKISEKSDTNRIDAACGLSILLNELCDDITIYSFSNNIIKVEYNRGFGLKNNIIKSQINGGTNLGNALNYISKNEEFDRLIIITDEQATDTVKYEPVEKTYVINMAPYRNVCDISYNDLLIRINGFSESVIDWIQEYEYMNDRGWKSEIEEILFMDILS